MNKFLFILLAFSFEISFFQVQSLVDDLLNKTIASSSLSLLENALDLQKYKPNDSIDFSLRMVNLDSTSAQFEIVDDNKTTINYAITYTLQTKDNSLPNQLISESATITKSFEMQTNSIYLMNKQEELLKNTTRSDAPFFEDNGEKTDSGENYNSAEKIEIKSKTWQEVHRFLANELESNRLYEINIDITAKLAHLSFSILKETLKVNNKKYKETKGNFRFTFLTTFDVDKAAQLACNNSKSNANQQQSSSSSCYLTNNDCSKCKSTCYKKEFNKIVNVLDDSAKKEAASKPVYCEPCPCDQSKSTGECSIVNVNNQQEGGQVNNFQPPVIKCKQCIIPYTGDQCNDCESEGIEFYKNEEGLCVKCDCNNNAYLDMNKDNTVIGSSRRKCSPITGMCNDCMFNTTGKHCNECKIGFKGDAIKRTCMPVKKEIDLSNNSSALNSKNGNQSIDSSHEKEFAKYSHLALFSIYIFSILFIILFAYFCVSYQSQHSGILKDVQFSSSICACGNLFSSTTYTNILQNLNESTRNQRSRLSFYLAYMCPFNISKLRSTNLNSGTNVNQNCIYTGTHTNAPDDDRLGLAEYQVFDDSLLNDESNVYIYKNTSTNKASSTNVFDISDNDDIKSSNKNPYQSLTIKS